MFLTSISGLNDASIRQDVTASNIANLNSKNYKQLNVTSMTLPNNKGVTQTIIQSNTPSNLNGNNVDLTSQIVNLNLNSITYKANTKAIQAQNQMLGSLLNIKI
ncbi:MAG: flagellar basal body protein [Desulfurella sp.]|jgi:flagellar hook protein FlgE|uniref:flagellar basal body protein n=1 Tax=Desulfurella TaxID=33001 RepID=UPI0003E0A4B1|nr:flagellar basal body protein [Desulfurella multipotens]AHF97986.1 hypothetical protein DESACE_05630 [Desulfurella acetivorans A63]PMP68679.1 MAG: hypothetical protein C0192_01450 [Desulfurella multipotens]